MNDIANQLASILDDPDSFEAIKSLAGDLLGNSDIDLSSLAKPKEENHTNQLSDMLGSISPDQMGTILKLMKAFNSNADDDRTKLLMALRPHLSQRRRERLDKAVKLLKLASVMPALSESGLLKL